jgi:hypothetical protein
MSAEGCLSRLPGDGMRVIQNFEGKEEKKQTTYILSTQRSPTLSK